MKCEIGNEKGITLIVLTVTIIILLILSAVTITAITGENGIISKSQQTQISVEKSKITNDIITDILKAQLEEEITQEKIEKILDKYGEVTYDDEGKPSGVYLDELPDEWISTEDVYTNKNATIKVNPASDTTWGTSTSVTIKVSGILSESGSSDSYQYFTSVSTNPSSVGTLTTYTSGTAFDITGSGKYYLFVKQISDSSGSSNTSGAAVIIDGVVYRRFGPYYEDNTAPTVNVKSYTTNSVTFTGTDSHSGISYYAVTTSTSTPSSWTSVTNTTSLGATTVGNLTQNKTYYVWLKDAVGKTACTSFTTGTVGTATSGLATGNIIASSPTWSNGKASVTLSTSSGLTIQYQVNSISGTWTSASSAGASITVSGRSHNDVIYARLWDGTNAGSEASVTIKDGTAPSSATISLDSTTATTATSVSATVTHKDSQSGVSITSCKYIYNTTSSELGTSSTSWSSATAFSANPQTLPLSTSSTGTYYLHVLTVDVAGNKTETVSSAITVTSVLVADGSFSSAKGVNTPKLADDMTPIKWNGSSWVETTGSDEDWYDYSTASKKWANAKTSDGSMWVWIPRFAYQISTNYHSGGSEVSGTVNIKFLKDTTNTAADGTTTWTNSSASGNWNIHPAFDYNGAVAGIWVAKFEASKSDATSSSSGSSTTLAVKPGVVSWRYISVGNAYTTCLSYNSTLNSHLMKNTEWGAIAYLGQSTYGKNGEVWINPNSNYVTGQAGTTASASATTSTYAYTDTQYGVNASTTGNVTRSV